MKVIGKETLGNKSRALALDTVTGGYFIPVDPKMEESQKTRLIQLRVTMGQSPGLENDGVPLIEINKVIGK